MTIAMIQAAQGLQRSETQVNQVARTVTALQGDAVDLSAQAAALLQAKNDFGANLKTLETGDEMTKSLLATL